MCDRDGKDAIRSSRVAAQIVQTLAHIEEYWQLEPGKGLVI